MHMSMHMSVHKLTHMRGVGRGLECAMRAPGRLQVWGTSPATSRHRRRDVYIVVAHIVVAYIVMADIVMAYIVMAYILMARNVDWVCPYAYTCAHKSVHHAQDVR